MPKIRVQFPDRINAMLLGDEKLILDSKRVDDAFDAVNEGLSGSVESGVILARPMINSVGTTRTTGGPAVVYEFTGDVSIEMLEIIERNTEKQIGHKATETLVIP